MKSSFTNDACFFYFNRNFCFLLLLKVSTLQMAEIKNKKINVFKKAFVKTAKIDLTSTNGFYANGKSIFLNVAVN